MITHVAIRFQNKIWSLPNPYRHHHIIRVIPFLDPSITCVDAYGEDQGFLDDTGKYLTREEAFIVATENNQVRANRSSALNKLFSEDVW